MGPFPDSSLQVARHPHSSAPKVFSGRGLDTPAGADNEGAERVLRMLRVSRVGGVVVCDERRDDVLLGTGLRKGSSGVFSLV